MYLKSDAIVVGRTPFRNTSLVVRCYTRRSGVLSALAKGAFRRRRKSEPPSVPDLFERGEVVAYVRPGRDLGIVREWTLDDMRPGLRSDYGAFRAAAGCASLVTLLGRDSGGGGEHFDALEKALAGLDTGASPRPVLWGFALGALARAGFLAPLDRCVSCEGRFGSPGAEAVGLSASGGGLLCRGCRAGARAGTDGASAAHAGGAFVALTPEAAAAARFLAGSSRAARTLRVSPRAAAALERAVRAFAEYTLERPVPALAPG
ncbi:MAG: DNA repair protein RecO [Planctomycetota bacterium]